MNIRQILFSKMANIYLGTYRGYLLEIRRLVSPHIPDIVDAFYWQLQEVEELGPILNNPQVEKKLRQGLTLWLEELFQDKSDLDAAIHEIIALGSRHAEININLHYIHHGLRILKREITSHLEESDHSQEWILEAHEVVDELMEIIFSLMSDSYFENLVKHQSNLLSMRMQAIGHNMALECERMRSKLSEWARDTLNFLHAEEAHAPEVIPYLQYSEFGLWLEHKGEMYLPEHSYQERLTTYVQEIDMELSQAATYRYESKHRRFRLHLRAFNERVSQASWYLAGMVDQAERVDSGRDALTNVLNRRYLETVLRRETEISNRQGFPFAVALLDLDFFKQVNDTYGHEAGDVVLRQFAELLAAGVRSSDFIFRYGGEEFLLILVNVRQDSAHSICEKLRNRCENHPFILSNDKKLKVTCSIGIAVFDGHPDPGRLIKLADAALYQAKGNGRNRLEMAKP
ncbi:MAG: GGDEF domain-containing protein [Magnetococcales bacterium]|nr:GGDEF domain-containing protein [Magnetococcales bacterium]NGZ27960.1 GGDEF domain-containing protein [Magnetococcales bacterium]